MSQISNSWEDGRRLCEYCHQYLAESAYYRHLNDKFGSICPGKSLDTFKPLEESTEEVLSSSEENVSIATESSFDFESSEEQFVRSESVEGDIGTAQNANCGLGCVPAGEDESIVSDSNSDFSFQSDLDEEIWEDSDDDAISGTELLHGNPDHPGKNVIFGISFFLNFLQLTYHISERAMSALLLFIRLLVTYMANLAQGNVIVKFISENIPKSMCTIRKIINLNQDITEYVVCPKCHRLYDLSECILVVNGKEESKLCDFIKFPLHPHTLQRSKCNTILMKNVIVGGKKKLVPRKSFFYHSVISSLQRLLAKKVFTKLSSLEKS